jgi:hypothetical protein
VVKASGGSGLVSELSRSSPFKHNSIRGSGIKSVQNCSASWSCHEANCILRLPYIALRAMRALVVQDDI